jgi:hypothetical protein
MDDRGNIYELDEKKKIAKNIETGKEIPFKQVDASGKSIRLSANKKINLTEIPADQVEKLKAMNRKERRAWLAEYRAQQKKEENK